MIFDTFQIDKGVIKKLATGELDDHDKSIIKHMCCDKVKNTTSEMINGTLVTSTKEVKVNCDYCTYYVLYIKSSHIMIYTEEEN